jgi:hypothetical protein
MQPLQAQYRSQALISSSVQTSGFQASARGVATNPRVKKASKGRRQRSFAICLISGIPFRSRGRVRSSLQKARCGRPAWTSRRPELLDDRRHEPNLLFAPWVNVFFSEKTVMKAEKPLHKMGIMRYQDLAPGTQQDDPREIRIHHLFLRPGSRLREIRSHQEDRPALDHRADLQAPAERAEASDGEEVVPRLQVRTRWNSGKVEAG